MLSHGGASDARAQSFGDGEDLGRRCHSVWIPKTEMIDYDALENIAVAEKPNMIIARFHRISEDRGFQKSSASCRSCGANPHGGYVRILPDSSRARQYPVAVSICGCGDDNRA